MKILNKFIILLLIFNLSACFNKKEKNKNSNKSSTNNSNPSSGIQFKVLQGVIDTSFGNGGVVLHDNAAFGGSGLDSGNAIKITSNGDILVCGESDNGFNDDLAIWKYKPNGILDENFGQGGIITRHNIAGGNGNESCSEIVVNSDDSFYITGTSRSGTDQDMFILKYKKNGAPDYNFGFGGVITYSSVGDDNINQIFKSNQNEIFIVGSHLNDALIWNYFQGGSRDTTFGVDGILNINTNLNIDPETYINESKILNNNKILILGYLNTNPINGFLARINPLGIMDPTFGNGGWINFNEDNGTYKSICHANNDFVIYASYDSDVEEAKLYKMKPDGSLDNSFGNNGFTNLGDSYIKKCLRSNLGDIYVISQPDDNINIIKLSEDGEIDNSFGDNGSFNYEIGTNDIIENVYFSIDGSILVTGYTILSGESQMFMIKVD